MNTAKRALDIEVTRSQIDQAIVRLDQSVAKYLEIQRSVVLVDPSSDRDFQRCFNGYYRIRRNAEWRQSYYGVMRDVRDSPAGFRGVLERLWEETGRVEASFASKLLATIDPCNPVIDSVVLGHLHIKLPSTTANDRLLRVCEIYRELSERLNGFLATDKGRYLVKQFRRHFRSVDIQKIKMVDFVLWRIRK